jgi:hypothetical protein
MLYGSIIAVYCENHTKYTNVLWGQNAEVLILNQLVYAVTTVL